MPKFRVEVTVTKSDTYEMEVEANSEGQAERHAELAWRDHTSENFQVDKPDTWESETEQLSWNCVECGVEITKEQNSNGDEMCEKCVDAYDASEAQSRVVYA
jgi:hypothetical protein